MPKFAATLASLLLIASSIGVNIARYPQVGRTLNAGQRSDAAELANSATVAQHSGPVATVNPDSLPAHKTEIEPAKSLHVAAAARLEKACVETPCDSELAPVANRPQPVPALPIVDVRPMVPVAGLPTATGEANPPAGRDEVRRLPPVEPSASAVADVSAAEPDEAQPYTATSTP